MEIAHGADGTLSSVRHYIVVSAENEQDYAFAKQHLAAHLKYSAAPPDRYPAEVRFDVNTDSKGTAKLTLQLIDAQKQRAT